MIHDYKCVKCDITEEKFVPLKDYDSPQYCDECNTKLERLFPMVGATHGDEAPWLSSTTEFLKDGDPNVVYNHPVASRGEYNKLMKEKGLEPVG